MEPTARFEKKIGALFRSACASLPDAPPDLLSEWLSGVFADPGLFDAAIVSLWGPGPRAASLGIGTADSALPGLETLGSRPVLLTDRSRIPPSRAALFRALTASECAWVGFFPLIVPGAARLRIGGVALIRKDPWPEGASLLSVEKGLAEVATVLASLRMEKKFANLSGFYATLHKISQLIARSPAPALLYQGVCRIAVKHGGLKLAWITLMNSKTGLLETMAIHGPARKYSQGITISADASIPEGNGPAGRALREGTVITTNITTDPNFSPWRERALSFGLRSSASFPFRRSGKLTGMLGLYSEDPDYFTPEVIALMHRLSEDMEYSLATYEQRRKIESLQHHLRQLIAITRNLPQFSETDPLFRHVVTQMTERLGGAFSAIVGVGENGRLTLLASSGKSIGFGTALPRTLSEGAPEGFGIVARTARTMRTVIVDNFRSDPCFVPWMDKILRHGFVSGGGFPLVVDEACAGVLFVASPVADYFSDEIADLLEGLAESVSSAVKDIRRKNQLLHLTRHDELTGIPNRTWFRESLERSHRSFREEGRPFCAGIIDLDNFKEVNDSLGHKTGDLLLREVAARLGSVVGPADTLCRIGGDEFGVILNGGDPATAVSRFWERLQDLLSRPVALTGQDASEILVTVSMGVASGSDRLLFPDDLMKQADQALYSAKDRGRNTWQLYTDELDRKIEKSFSIRRSFREAIDRGLLHLHLQPQVNLGTGLPVGAEALLRWKDPGSGDFRLPGAFLPIIEKDLSLVTLLAESPHE